MIHRFRVQNYKALRDVELELTPMHVLIGPNDSGKTSVLEALTAICRSVDHQLPTSFTGGWDGTKLVWNRSADLPILLVAEVESSGSRFEYALSTRFSPKLGKEVRVEDERVDLRDGQESVSFASRGGTLTAVFRIARGNIDATARERETARLVRDSLSGVHYYHWDPHLLALPVAAQSSRRFRMEPTGFGLAQCLDDILGDDRRRFTELEERFKAIFPQITSIKLVTEPAYRSPADDTEPVSMLSRAEGKGIYFGFHGATDPVSAAQVSDGVLLVLAYLTILYLPQPPRLVLIEEPENGIHPARLRDVLSILRDLVGNQTHTQVLLTTHSPYVVDSFSPEEVTLCRRESNGEISVTRLSESQKVREQLDVFTLGEIWSAEGDDALAASTAKTAP